VHCLEVIVSKEVKGSQAQVKKFKLHLKKRFFKEDEVRDSRPFSTETARHFY